MSKPTEAARALVGEYCSARGQDTPENQATSFLRRINFYWQNATWRSDDLVDTAARILELATFDVDDLAENHLGVRVSIERLEMYDKRAGAQVFGVAYPCDREIVICERAERYQPLYRTCVGHEIGHLILHTNARTVAGPHYAPESNRRPPEEREADEFMVALLAPGSVLKLATAFAAMESGLHFDEVWWHANSARGCYQWKNNILPCLIDRLCLSRLLLLIQMRRLGILTDSTVEYHKTYKLPNRWRPSRGAAEAEGR